MSGSLITLPLRLGVRSAQLGMRGAGEVAERTFGLVGLVAGALRARPAPTPTPPPAPAQPAATQPAATQPAATQPAAAQPAPAQPPPAPAPGQDAPAPPAFEPAHVSEEPVLVEEVAEAGAEDGAGAEVRVAEPWEGYRAMNAVDVMERITGAETAVLAAVQLYELSNRRRQTVLDAVQDELRDRR